MDKHLPLQGGLRALELTLESTTFEGARIDFKEQPLSQVPLTDRNAPPLQIRQQVSTLTPEA